MVKAQDAKKTLERRYKKMNEHIRENYDRISVTIPKGCKQKITDDVGMSINGYINELIKKDFAERGIEI